jgi:methionyl-tRNA formyltransferase
MRVAFFGTPAYAVPTLDALVQAGHEVVTVVAQPDQRHGRGRKLQSPPVVQRARELGLETRQPRGVRTGPFPTNYGQLELDVAVVVAYGRILTPHLLAVPRLGCVNGHASLLPRWRGAAPIQHAILAGDRVTGVTTMQMDEGLDTGDMLLRRELDIGPDETTAELVVETLDQLEQLSPTPQPAQGVTHAHMLAKEHGRLDWSRGAQELHDHVRGLQPWPGAFCTFRGGVFKIKRARIAQASGPAGQVIEAGKRLVIGCGQGALEVLEGQLPGKKAVSGGDLVNGGRIELGERMNAG